MTPQREEAERFLRLAKRDQAAFAALLNASAVDPAVACFHAQQAAEKALKAVMCLRGLEYRRTHDLEELAGTLADIGIVPPADEIALRCLTPYAVEFRYDDEAIHLISGDEAGRLIDLLLAWATAEIASNSDTN
ncbi:MAG: HEPN domain-containing protein [Sulfuricella sp.]